MSARKIGPFNILVSQADPDTLVVTETWLKKSRNNSDVSINGCNIYRIDRIGSGCCYICKNYYYITVPKCFEFIALPLNVDLTIPLWC